MKKKTTDNKLFWSLVLALGMVVIVILIFTTAKMTPAMHKYSGKPYYDIPKGKSSDPVMSPESRLKSHAKVGFIDPIVKSRMQEERDGVPSPLDIMNTPGILPGIHDKAFPQVHAPEIPGYGKAPKSPYDVLYDPDSPFEFTGRPGRLGEKMKRYMNPDDKRKAELGLTGVPFEPTSESDDNQSEDISITRMNTDNIDIDKIGRAVLKIFFSVMESRKGAAQQPDEPVEGQLEEASPGEIEKLTGDE